jgi:hypothetical protein
MYFQNTPLKAIVWLTDVSMNMHNLKGHQNATLYGMWLDLWIGVYQTGMESKGLVLISLSAGKTGPPVQRVQSGYRNI